MEHSQNSLVDAQFGPRAKAYVASQVHSSGDDLKRMGAMLQGHSHAAVLDLGCGGGHVTYTVAPHVASVVACDLSYAMLEAVEREAKDRGLSNISVQQGSAEHLPFENGQFDWVLSRYSAHHWHNLPTALSEIARVLKPGGTVLLADLAAPTDPKADTFLQAIEMLRDPSHIKSRSPDEWKRLMADARLRVKSVDSGRLRMEYRSWLERMNTPALHDDAIISLQKVATRDMRTYFEITEDGDFSVDTVFIVAD